MGIRFYCPNGHKLNVKEFQAGRRGICPFCGAKMLIPLKSTRPASSEGKGGNEADSDRSDQPSDVTIAEADRPTTPPAGAPAAKPAVKTLAKDSPVEPTATSSFVVDEAASSAPAAPRPRPIPVGGAAPLADQGVPGASPAAAAPMSAAEAAAAALQNNAMPAPPPVAAADPITEAGEAVWYVRPPSGGQYGPAGPEIMRAWLNEGRVAPDSLVWREGWRDWQRAAEVFPQLMPAPPAFEGGFAAPLETGYPPAPRRRN